LAEDPLVKGVDHRAFFHQQQVPSSHFTSSA
jgi:hypothetical protein